MPRQWLSSTTIFTGSAEPRDRLELLDVDLHAAVAGDRGHHRAARRREAATPIAAGNEKPMAPIPPHVRKRWPVAQAQRLGRPHLVLADVGHERHGRRPAAESSCMKSATLMPGTSSSSPASEEPVLATSHSRPPRRPVASGAGGRAAAGGNARASAAMRTIGGRTRHSSLARGRRPRGRWSCPPRSSRRPRRSDGCRVGSPAPGGGPLGRESGSPTDCRRSRSSRAQGVVLRNARRRRARRRPGSRRGRKRPVRLSCAERRRLRP